MPALPFTSVILDKLFNPFAPHLYHFLICNGDDDSTHFIGLLWGVNEIVYAQCSEHQLVHSAGQVSATLVIWCSLLQQGFAPPPTLVALCSRIVPETGMAELNISVDACI